MRREAAVAWAATLQQVRMNPGAEKEETHMRSVPRTSMLLLEIAQGVDTANGGRRRN
jgi:hypothetical protein